MGLNGVWRVLTRKKIIDSNTIGDSKLSRFLRIGDLTALGVGSTLGVGIYVLAGQVAKNIAGPSVVVSFLLAAIASVFAGLCYAEFGARVPRAGSAYIYSYVCMGEFMAFIIGWNLILEYVIGSASVSRGVSLYVDSIFNNSMKIAFEEVAPMTLPNISPYFDFFAFALSILVGGSLAFGLKQSSNINNVFTVFNLCVVIFIIAVGSLRADINNWFAKPEGENVSVGEGGFFPFGLKGTLKGAATCFFGFVGFDCIATTGEEVKNPKKSIPLAIILSLAIIFLSYFGVSAILTLMIPYYLQDVNAPIPHAFDQANLPWAKWIVTIGGIFGLLSSLFGAMFPLPRILYAMASDGLIFRFFGNINTKFKTPVVGTIFASVLTGILAGMFELEHLVNMMSIGTLMAYTIVAICIVVLRYEYEGSVSVTDESRSLLESDDNYDEKTSTGEIDRYDNELKYNEQLIGSVEDLNSIDLLYKKNKYKCSDVFRQLINCNMIHQPTSLSSNIVAFLVLFYCIFCISFSLCLSYMWKNLLDETIWSIIVTSIFGFLMLLTLIFVALQPKANAQLSFKVPLVPLIPFISIFINIYLMLMLDVHTWIRFGVWMAVGIPIYLGSICMYDRGTNYIANVQKSSLNGQMNGNLNYGFEDLDECQDHSPPVDYNSVVNSEAGSWGGISDSELNKAEHLSICNNDSEVVVIENKLGERCNIIEEISDANNSETIPDSYSEEIMQILDQVLQDAEDASNKSSEMIVEEISIVEDSKNNTDINVVAMVHQEDIMIQNEKDDVNTMQVELCNKNEPEIIIPEPPPMDEEYFKTKMNFKLKSPKLVRNYGTERIYTKHSKGESVNDTSNPLNKTDFIAKLNLLFENRSKNSDENVPIIQRAISVNPEQLSSNQSKHKSEPDIMAAIKRELLQNKLVLKSMTTSEDLPSLNNKKMRISISSNDLHLLSAFKPETEEPIDIPPEETKEIVEKEHDTNDTEDEPFSREEIKKKLEMFFSKPLTSSKRSSKVSKETKTNIEVVERIEPEVKPKEINLTNTMKLQRVRFQDVLKSFQQVQDDVDIAVDNEMSNMISIPRARLSMPKKNILNENFYTN